MAGIYIHIPFCKKACHYCDFHFSTSMEYRTEMVEAISHELIRRRHYSEDQNIQTIYLGGGTPSILSYDELMKLTDTIYNNYSVEENAEFTLEANPDDLTKEKIRELAKTPVNRLSIGIQSFRDEDLVLMNRSHNASQSVYSVKASQDAGFSNISGDLIYGIPGLDMDAWKSNLNNFFNLEIPHLSAYSLTIEERTVFSAWVKKGKMNPPPDDLASDQFLYLTEAAPDHKLFQYEVSNFSQPGKESKHNTSYWKGEHYIGVGPSAHSFDGTSRQWNISNNQLYLRGMTNGEEVYEKEILDENTRLNEMIMTGLRTTSGLDLEKINTLFGINMLDMYAEEIEKLITGGNMIEVKNHLRLTPSGLLFADRIASGFFVLNKSVRS